MKSMHMIIVVCVCILLSGAGVGTAQGAEQFPEVMFILDASGSMWQKMDDSTRIETAREVMAELVPSLPPEVKVGLTAYGHNRKNDCEDVEVLIPSGSDDREGLVATVNKLSPKGMTPIADSVKLTVESLKSNEKETTVILITDGEETCNDDPCGVVKALKESGLNFIMHVVGFGVTEKEHDQLKCLADAAGGQYFDADNAAGLLAALDTVKQEVAVKVEKAKTVEKKSVSKLGKLHIFFPGKNESVRTYKLIRTEDGKLTKTAEDPSSDETFPLLSGEYELVVGFANPNYRDPTEVSFGTVTVNGGETTDLEFGVAVFNIADSLSDLPVETITFSDNEDGVPTVTHEPEDNDYYVFRARPLPAGTYTCSILYSESPEPMVLNSEIVVETGKETYITVDSGIQLTKPTDGSGDVEGWDLVPASSDAPLLQVRRRWDNQHPLWKVFAVPAGTYDIHLRLKGMDEPLPVGEGVSIKAGDLLQFDTGL